MAGSRARKSRRGDAGPGILETGIVLGLSALLAVAILVFFGGQLADVIRVIVDAAHVGQ